MSKHFRPWKIDEAQLLPASVQDYVPKDHVSRFIVALVREHLDLIEIEASYGSILGQPPFHPALMTALLLHGYASGIYSSRRIAKACIERADFMMIVAGDAPDFRTISDFRKRHLQALEQAVRAGPEAVRGGGAGEARARGVRRHEDQGECVQAQGDELRAHEEARGRAAGGSGSLAGCRGGCRRGGGQAAREPARRRDAELGCRQEEASRQDPRGESGVGGRGQGRRGGGDAAPSRSRGAAQRRRPQEERPPPAPPSEEPDGKAQRNFTDPRAAS